MNIEANNKRPVAVLILAWILLLFSLFQIFLIPFNYDDFSLGRNLWNFSIKFTLIIAAIGFIQLKRWAVYLYFSVCLVYILTFYMMPPTETIYNIYTQPSWLLAMIIAPIVTALVVLPHWKDFGQ